MNQPIPILDFALPSYKKKQQQSYSHMSTFQKVTKLGSAPLAAAAIATTTANFLGRPTTSRTTHHLANANSKHLQTLIQYYSQRGNNSAVAQVKFSHSNSIPLSCNNHHRPVSILARRNLTSAKPSTPKQQSISSTDGMHNQFNQRGSTTAAAGNSNSTKKVSFMEWYEGHLQARPVQTKMVTGSILWGLGDVVAQVVPQVFFDNNDQNDGAKKDGSNGALSKSLSPMDEFSYDYLRTARAMIFGFGIHAPLSHAHFNFLEWMTVRGGFTGLNIAVFKAFMEQVRILIYFLMLCFII